MAPSRTETEPCLCARLRHVFPISRNLEIWQAPPPVMFMYTSSKTSSARGTPITPFEYSSASDNGGVPERRGGAGRPSPYMQPPSGWLNQRPPLDVNVGCRIQDVDQPIVDYINNVLADEDFDFGVDGEGAFEALGELLVDSECRSVCSKISEKFGKHGLVKAKPTVRSLLAPLRMYDGMDEEEAPKKKPEPVDGPLLTEGDKMKLERRKRKDDRRREREMDLKEEAGKSSRDLNGGADKNAIAQRLEEIYKRLEFIDA
ncbi:unnamed protein product [Fraxinus pennsylvanica]|uniref:ABCF3 PWI-like helical bundle domain-containing protein n=1 Tax=Fraxinus pennsylvanica TaxID=56036 RepID=A0AAD1Z3J1_9LAMI|nr:unnamed protein product [Fraxinus pennsylvanica]